jgi:predicted membrane channel-forming protein YqfA (hemolysin III family)
VVWDKIKDPQKTVSHVVLVILAGNLLLYMLHYIIRKMCEAQLVNKKRIYIGCGKFKIPLRFSSGTFFAVLAILFAGFAGYFYSHGSSKRSVTPAESRNLNSNCNWLNFYDYHDLWHFCSGAGIFMAFMALLTMDDDLLFVPRNKIVAF